MAEQRGAVLDSEGTLADSNDATVRAWVTALSEGGFAIPFERVRPLIRRDDDTPCGIEAASKVGGRMSAVRCGGWSDHDLGVATAIDDDPADLLTHYAESSVAREARGGAR